MRFIRRTFLISTVLLTLSLSTFPQTASKPDLSKLTFEERQSIELACWTAKTNGPAQYDVCLSNQLAQLSNSVQRPDLSKLTYAERQSVQLACWRAKTNGPAQYNACLSNQLAQLSNSVRRPDLSKLTYEERQSIELACWTAKTNGPAEYNACLSDQLMQQSPSTSRADLSQHAHADDLVPPSVSRNTGHVDLTRSNPNLRKLDYFRGNWTITGEVYSTLFEAKGSFTGDHRSEWAPDGLSLISSWAENRPSGSNNGKAAYTYDPNQNVYTFHGSDSQGEEENATGTLNENTWTWTGHPQLPTDETVTARFTIKEISPSSYTFKYEVAQGDGWEIIFDGKATKSK